jgi:hypothetical protein
MRVSASNSDEDSGVVEKAMHALCEIAYLLDGAQAIVNAKALDDVLILLESPSSNVRYRACELVKRLAGYKSTAPAILELEPCVRLVSLLR